MEKKNEKKYWLIEVEEYSLMDEPNMILVIAGSEQEAMDKARRDGWKPLTAKEPVVIQ